MIHGSRCKEFENPAVAQLRYTLGCMGETTRVDREGEWRSRLRGRKTRLGSKLGIGSALMDGIATLYSVAMVRCVETIHICRTIAIR
jgi:hypothetical protein